MGAGFVKELNERNGKCAFFNYLLDPRANYVMMAHSDGVAIG